LKVGGGAAPRFTVSVDDRATAAVDRYSQRYGTNASETLRELAAAWGDDELVRRAVASWRDWVAAPGSVDLRAVRDDEGGRLMKKHRVTQVVRSQGGTAMHVAQLAHVEVPDCWKAVEKMRRRGSKKDAELVLETWHLCHDLLAHIRKLEAQADD
jgi:hypothetical protein